MKKNSILIVFIFLFSCVDDFNHRNIETTITNPDINNKTEITFSQLYDLHNNEIGKDTIVLGYVASSDIQGNFYREMFIQNTLKSDDLGDDNPRMGMKIRVGLNTTSTKYAKGRKIVVNLEGLKKTTSNDLLTLGKPSNTYIKDISEFDIDTHIHKMDEVGEVIPKTVTLTDLSNKDFNTLVKIENLQFKESQIGVPFAGLSTDDFDGKRILEYCSGFRKDTIVLETSNFADFSSKETPGTQLDITALYHINFDKEPILILNKFEDIEETSVYVECEHNTPNVLMTEVTDPKNASLSRYVELYNAEATEINLRGWTLVRYNYTNTKNTKELAALSISLDGVEIPAKGFAIITRDETVFKSYFGEIADLTSSKLDGNGDDAYELIDSSGAVVDVYGSSNIDGSGTDWEYTDGVAKRKSTVNNPNNIFDITEWNVQLDQESSVDYNPRVR